MKSSIYHWVYPIIGMAWGIRPKNYKDVLSNATGAGGEPDGLIEHYWVWFDDMIWRAACDPNLTMVALEQFSSITITGIYRTYDQQCAKCKQRKRLFGLDFEAYWNQWQKDGEQQ